MRRVLLLVFLLLIPSVWAEEVDSWTVEVEDPLGNPISDCEITLTEPWTGAVLTEPSEAMYQPSAICEGYVVMWHPPVVSSQTTVVLEAYPIIEDLFTVQGAHTIQVLGSTWESSVTNGSVDAPNGLPVLVIGDGGSVMRTGQSSITIPDETTTYSLDGNFTDNISLSAFHTGSGNVVNWINNNLTVGEFGGGWTARVMVNGMPVGQSIWPPTVDWMNEQINATSLPGNANLVFSSNLQPNEQIVGSWSANHIFNTGLGLSFIPGVQAGIASQVDRFLNGDTNQLESLLQSMAYSNGKEALCCLIDDGPVMFENLDIESEIDLSSGFWGWNETASITASRSQISMLRLEVPFQNDLRQITPLSITTDGEWQYLSSPLGEWIDGSTDNFTLYRSESSVSGYYTITLGPNAAPVVSLSEGYALPWDNTSYDFEVAISDAPLSTHICQWNVSGLNFGQGVNLSMFPIDSEIPVYVSCSDEGGLIGYWNDTFVLDGGMPWINASNDVQEISPGFFDWNLIVGDDHDDNLRVYWTSNKSLEWWYTGDHLQTTFNVDSNLNSINDNLTERHKKRNPIEYWLAVEVTDDAGHSTNGNWTIRLLDTAGPVVIPSIENMNDGEWIPTTSMMRPGDKIRLNLSESFDDHSAIDEIKFSITILDQEYEDLSWSQIQYWELPELGVGMHQINVIGYDEAGNFAGTTFGVAIAPPIARNLEIVGISPSSPDVEPGENQFWVTVQNNGASTTEFTLCSGSNCVDSIVGPSSYSKSATTIVAMNVDLDWFETFSVELSYLDDSNNTVNKQKVSEYDSGAGIGGLELSLLVGLLVVLIVWLRSRNEPRF